eukprot:CAMPEP_0113301976 /NCGR_PEP_ID=MMETSP0010_2-20120614/2978_1 /TAXON_ID=216773 ORGANISM="Corethron hystrix, Strain 308" /NCGR_SAMPLE_ID=MMETSP0010_2 /ASSEMBLY_ACC=CAM_ASM_000155 /LENGTH=459 /DNA_ID=CAMNT_0000155683 /DNA_START=797 /DNA_END=2176 /DNA_ORIENTATION=- /assembly_acc=CAM_ASM_000155
MECDYTKLSSGFDVYLSLQSSSAEKNENQERVKYIDVFVECVGASIATSKAGIWVGHPYVSSIFYEKAFPMNKRQKKTKEKKSTLNFACEQAIQKGLVIYGKNTHQGIIKYDLADMQSPMEWRRCHFSLPSAVEKMEKPAEQNKSIVEKIIIEKTEMKQEHTHSLQATDAQTSQQTTSISSNQIKLKGGDVDNTESHTNNEVATEQSLIPFHGNSSARPSSEEATDIASLSSSLSYKETTNQIEIILRHTPQHSNENDQHLGKEKPVALYPHLSSPISRRWGMEVVRLVDGNTDDDKGTGKLVVDSVLTESLAYEAGVRSGDVIVGVFGGPVVASKQLFRMLARTEYVEMTIKRTVIDDDDDDSSDDFPTISTTDRSVQANENMHNPLGVRRRIGSSNDNSILPSSTPLKRKKIRENDSRDRSSAPGSSRNKIVTTMFTKPQEQVELIDMTALENDDNY